MRDGFRFRGTVPGGASTDFLPEEHLDVTMDFESLPKAGSRLGTGAVIVLDDRTCPVGMVLNLMSFFARESCGWCTPCREGLPWAAHSWPPSSMEPGRRATWPCWSAWYTASGPAGRSAPWRRGDGTPGQRAEVLPHGFPASHSPETLPVATKTALATENTEFTEQKT